MRAAISKMTMTIHQRIKQIEAEYPALMADARPWTPEALGRMLRDMEPDEHGEVPHIPSLGLRREYVTPCGHKIAAEESGIDWMDDVLRRERRRADLNRAWAWIFAYAAGLLLVAFILMARIAAR